MVPGAELSGRLFQKQVMVMRMVMVVVCRKSTPRPPVASRGNHRAVKNTLPTIHTQTHSSKKATLMAPKKKCYEICALGMKEPGSHGSTNL